MAVYKDHSITLDTKRTPKVSLQNIVAGETGNRITVTFTNGLSVVSLASATHRVCLRVDSALGTRRQDSSLEDSGITFNAGKAVILLSKDSFTAGLNRACLEVYTTESESDDTLICSAEFQFYAADNPTGENAGSVYPSLIALENELRALINEASHLSPIYVMKTADTTWDGADFEATAYDSDEAFESYENGKVFSLIVLDDDEVDQRFFLEAYRDTDADEIVCYCLSGGHCTISFSGTVVQVQGTLNDE